MQTNNKPGLQEYVLLELDENLGYIQAIWLRQPTSPVFRETLSCLADQMLAKDIRKALFDIRDRSYISLGDQNWLLREILPRFAEKPFRVAYLTTLQGLALMDTYNIRQAVLRTYGTGGEVAVEHFTEPEAARHWLLDGPAY